MGVSVYLGRFDRLKTKPILPSFGRKSETRNPKSETCPALRASKWKCEIPLTLAVLGGKVSLD